MSDPSQPHDSLFKRAFSDAASGGALLRSVLPAPLIDRVEWSTLQKLPGEFTDPNLKGLESDLLLTAKLGDRDALFYFLIEHQSSVQAEMPWRMWKYVSRIWERYAKKGGGRNFRLPLVVPVVVYHGERPWTAARSMSEVIDLDEGGREAASGLVPKLTYILDDLTQLDGASLRARGLPAFATVAMWALRTASDRGFLETAWDLSDLFDAVREASDGREALWTIFSYLSAVSREGEDLVGTVVAQLSQPVREDVMDLVENFAQQKKEEGRAEGRVEGERGLLLKLVTLKFGAPSDAVEARVAAAALEDVERWAERILTASSLEEMFAS